MCCRSWPWKFRGSPKFPGFAETLHMARAENWRCSIFFNFAGTNAHSLDWWCRSVERESYPSQREQQVYFWNHRNLRSSATSMFITRGLFDTSGPPEVLALLIRVRLDGRSNHLIYRWEVMVGWTNTQSITFYLLSFLFYPSFLFSCSMLFFVFDSSNPWGPRGDQVHSPKENKFPYQLLSIVTHFVVSWIFIAFSVITHKKIN